MTKPKRRKLHKNICVAFARLSREGEFLCRQSSTTDEAMKGGGFLYFMKKSGRAMPPATCMFLIDNGLVEAQLDGLFAETSQSFRPVPAARFDAFRAEYEAANV